MKTKYKIQHKIISIIIIITLINISNISKASLIGGNVTISATEYNDMPYVYNDEERKSVLRITDNNIPVYVMKKNNINTSFTANNIEFYNDEIIKNILKNGYGCKTLEELGTNNYKEAYFATQEAIYIIKEGRDIDDYKIIEGEEERANRILNITRRILENVSKEKPSTVSVNSNDIKWKTYEENNDYKYKEYTIKSSNTIPGDIIIEKGENIKLIDKATNQVKQTFNNMDVFYLVVPKDLEQEIKLKFNYERKDIYLYTYRKGNTLEEQYILAENSEFFSSATFTENVVIENNVEILNQDQETKLAIVGNKFSIIKEDGTVINNNLTTNEEGKINIRLPKGKYYLKQTSAIQGYNLNKALIEIKIDTEEKNIIKIESAKTTTEEITIVNKEINVTEENKDILQNNITEVSNIKTTNTNKEIINQTNETNLHNINNFINTINRKMETNLEKENTYNNYIEEIFTKDKLLDGEDVTLRITRNDYINYIDMVMLNSAKVPILPIASK